MAERSLRPTPEPGVFRILYDMRQKKRELWKDLHSSGNEKTNWKSRRAEMDATQEKLLAEILSADQLEKYHQYRERDREWWREHKRRHRKDNDKDAEKAATQPAP